MKHRLFLTRQAILALGLLVTFSGIAPALADPPESSAAKVPNESGRWEDDTPAIFKGMGVIQRKAMRKAGKILLSPQFSMDFTDAPLSQYGFQVGAGYAFSDFFELYVDFSPSFISKKRKLAEAVEQYQVGTPPQQLIIAGGRAKTAIGAELLWAPLYGKDSLGIRRIIRSDTFIRIAAHQITYDVGKGMKYGLGIGKTYFLGKSVGFRVSVTESKVDLFIDGKKTSEFATFLETGFVFYL